MCSSRPAKALSGVEKANHSGRNINFTGCGYRDVLYGYAVWQLDNAGAFGARCVCFRPEFFINAYKQARNGQANMDTLVALSTGIAFLFSTFNTIYPEFWYRQGLMRTCILRQRPLSITFISLGKLLEESAKSNTSSALKSLWACSLKR